LEPYKKYIPKINLKISQNHQQKTKIHNKWIFKRYGKLSTVESLRGVIFLERNYCNVCKRMENFTAVFFRLKKGPSFSHLPASATGMLGF